MKIPSKILQSLGSTACLLIFCGSLCPAEARSAAKEIERAEFLFFHGDRLGAIEMLEKAKDIDTDSADIRTRLLNLYFLEKMRKEAKSECRELMKLKPNDAASYLMMANLEKEDNNLDAAIEVLKNSPVDVRSGADLVSLLGFCYLQSGKFALAKDSFLKALAADRKRTDSRVGLAIAYWRDGDLQSGLKTIDAVITESPSTGDIRKLKGDMLAAAGRFEEALKELEFAKEKQVKGAHSSLGQIYLKQNKLVEAEVALRKATEQNREDSLSFFLLAQLYEKCGKLEEAIREYRNSAYLETDKEIASKISTHADTLSAVRKRERLPVLSQPKDPVELFGFSYKDLIRAEPAVSKTSKGKK